jgi:hypothetical protein
MTVAALGVAMKRRKFLYAFWRRGSSVAVRGQRTIAVI